MEKVINLIKEQKMFSPGNVVGIAVSGGSDSMALLHFLFNNREIFDIEVVALHVNHNTRENDKRDLYFVEDYCKQNGIRFYKFSVEARRLIKQKGYSMEQACREARYNVFENLKEKGLVDKIAIAHHLNDQAETVLLHLLRGSGLNGASGMQYVRDDFYVRPFLDIKKDEILSYVYENEIPYLEDETNQDTTISRNLLRNKILPELRRVWPNVDENLCNFAEICKEDDETIRSLMNFDAVLFEKGIVKIPLSYFSYKSSFINRLILDCFEKLGITQGVQKNHIDLICSLAKTGENGAKLTMPQNVTVHKEYEYITLAIKKAKQEVITEWPFKKGITNIEDYGSIQVKKTEQREPVVGSLLIDADKVPKGAKWRFKKDGDFIEKFGGGIVKVKKYLSDKKIPLRVRNFLPMLCVGSEVLAIASVDISESLKVDENTKNAYLISFKIKNWV